MDTLGQLPINRNATVADDKFIQAGFDMLSNATGGIAQFFDRDAEAEMASAANAGLSREFMVLPDQSGCDPWPSGTGAPAPERRVTQT